MAKQTVKTTSEKQFKWMGIKERCNGFKPHKTF